MVTGKLDPEIEKLLIEEYEDPKYGCKYDGKVDELVWEVLMECEIVEEQLFDRSRWYNVVERVVKLGDKYLQYYWYDVTGDNTPSDMGLSFDLSRLRFVKPVEKTVVVYE